jgi:hypothetical protein
VSFTYIQGSYLYPANYNCEWIHCLTKLDRLSIHSLPLIEPRHHPIPQNQLYCSFAELEQIADRGSFCRKSLKIPFLSPDGLFSESDPHVILLTKFWC